MANTKCKKCGYEWQYKGKLMKRTCPNCSYSWVERIDKEWE